MACYFGETARSLAERLGEHLEKPNGHIQAHLQLYHPDHQGDPAEIFKLEVLKMFSSPLFRQICEAIRVANHKGILMYRKYEWTRCYIPRIEFAGSPTYAADKPLTKPPDQDPADYLQRKAPRSNY